MKNFAALFLIASYLNSCGALNESAPKATTKAKQIVGFAFDWDDNIFIMPTEIVLFNKKTNKEKKVSTQKFSVMRTQVGQPGTDWADYETRPSLVDGSLRFFGDEAKEGSDLFMRDIDQAMATKDRTWKGPVWDAFVTAMRTKERAADTSIITARMHSPETIEAALQNLRERKFFANTPSVENIWPVANPNFNTNYNKVFGADAPPGDASNPSPRKAAVMEQILDRVNKTPLPVNAVKRIEASGVGSKPLHLWGFSDDDYGNYAKAVEVLQKGVDTGRWPLVKITVFYTGTNREDQKPHAVVLRPHAEPRPFTEINEYKN